MAKVEMDLAELKALEKSIENLEKEKQDLVDNQHQVIVIHKHYDGKIVYGSKAYDKNLNITGFYQVNNLKTSKYVDFNSNLSFEDLINSEIFKIELNHNNSKTTKDYINMSEAIDQIRKEEEEKLQFQIDELKRKCRSLEVSAETLVEDSKKEIIRIRKAYQEKEEELITNFNNKIDNLIKEKIELDKLLTLKYNNLKQEFEDFKADKKRISLEDQILELTNQLKAEKAKGFWSKLFN